MKYTILYIALFTLFSCSREMPSQDKMKAIRILENIESDEIGLVKGLSNSEIQHFKTRPNHDILFSIGTLVHEGNHKYHEIDNNSKIKYRLGKEYSKTLKRHKVFESKELLESMLPQHIEYFNTNNRFKLYIADTEGIKNMSTQINGLYGLLDEYNSYYQDMKTVVSLYKYVKNTYDCSNSDIWVNYLGLHDNVMKSMSEFRYFTTAYIQHAKNKYPETYEKLKYDQDLEEMLEYLRIKEKSILSQYNEIQKEILNNCKNHIDINGNTVSVPQAEIGYRISIVENGASIFDKLIQELKTRDNRVDGPDS